MPDKEPKPVQQNRTTFLLLSELLVMSYVSLLVIVVIEKLRDTTAVQGDPISVWMLLTTFVVVTALLFLSLKQKWGSKLFGAMFALAIFLGIGEIALALFGFDYMLILTSIAVLIYYRKPKVLFLNIIIATGIAGISIAFGSSFVPETFLIVIAVIAVYDIIAVFYTQHMVKMAKMLLREKTVFALILSETPKGYLAPQDSAMSDGRFMFLGTGDIVLPATMIAATSLTYGPVKAIPVIIGVLMGFIGLHVLFLRGKRKPMPALPPIALGTALGYLVSLFI